MLAQAAAVRRLGISFRMPNAVLAALTHRKTRLNPCDTAAEAGEPIAGAVISKRKWPVPEGPAKFEQGGFTSRRRKGPKTLFPGASPGNSFEAFKPRKLVAMQYRAKRNIVV